MEPMRCASAGDRSSGLARSSLAWEARLLVQGSRGRRCTEVSDSFLLCRRPPDRRRRRSLPRRLLRCDSRSPWVTPEASRVDSPRRRARLGDRRRRTDRRRARKVGRTVHDSGSASSTKRRLGIRDTDRSFQFRLRGQHVRFAATVRDEERATHVLAVGAVFFLAIRRVL